MHVSIITVLLILYAYFGSDTMFFPHENDIQADVTMMLLKLHDTQAR